MEKDTAMKVLIADNNEGVGELVRLFIELEFNAQTLSTHTVQGAMDAIRKEQDLGCIISTYTLGKSNCLEILKYMGSQGRRIPFILSGQYSEADAAIKNHPVNAYIQKPWLLETLKPELKKWIPPKGIALPRKTESPLDDDYCKIKMTTLLRFGSNASDLYVRLASGKHIKVFRSDDAFDLSDFERFEAQGIEYLYLQTSDAEKFIEQLCKSVESISKFKTLHLEPAIKMSTETWNLIAEFSVHLGFSKQTQELTRMAVHLAIKSIRKKPSLAELLDAATIDPANYLSTHSIALAYVACGISSAMGRTSESTFYQLSLAAFLHDLPLSDPELAKIQSMKELGARRRNLGDSKVAQVIGHPEEAVALLNQIEDAPAGTDMILMQHHERPDGSGFPKHLGSEEITPLSAIFIIAHELICFYPSLDNKADLDEFFDYAQKNFAGKNFKRVLRVLNP